MLSSNSVFHSLSKQDKGGRCTSLSVGGSAAEIRRDTSFSRIQFHSRREMREDSIERLVEGA